MSTSRILKRSILLIALLAFFGISVVYLWHTFGNISDDVQEPQYIYYIFDPATILESLAQANTDIFEQQSNDFEPTPIEAAEIVEWSQMDYLHVAGAVHKKYWSENIENWNLHFMIFTTECEHFDKGPQRGVFRYYAIANPLIGTSGYDETINIDPSTKSILLRYDGLDSRSEYSRSINLSQVKISLHDALQIAEDNGGREARSRVENSCWIDAVLSPYERNKGWNVFYYDNERHKILEIIIDDTTGENQIIWPLTQ